jgi:hypothetical protein
MAAYFPNMVGNLSFSYKTYFEEMQCAIAKLARGAIAINLTFSYWQKAVDL